MRGSTQRARDAGRPRMATAWLGALPFIGLLTFVLGVGFGVSGGDIPILGLAIITIVFCLVPVILDQARPAPQRHLLLSLFSLAWMMFFAVPVFTRYLGNEPGPDTPLTSLLYATPADIVQGQLAALVALLLVYLSYTLPFARMTGQAIPKMQRDWSNDATLLVAAAILPLGWTVYLGGQFGLIPRWAGSGVLGTFASATYYGVALLGLALVRYRSRAAVIFLAVMIPITMGFNFFTGSKRLFLIAPGMVVMAFMVHNRRIRIRYIAAGFLAVALLYPTAQFYRDVILVENTLSAVQVLRNPSRAVSSIVNYTQTFKFGEYMLQGIKATGNRSSALDILTTIVRDTPDKVPFQGGWSLGYIVLNYVPRFLWHDKPDVTIGQFITDNYTPAVGMRTFTGPSWVGELYMNFGYLGIIGGMLFCGFYFRILHEWLFWPGATIPALWLGMVAMFATFPTLGGGILALFNFMPFFGVPILVAHWLVNLVVPARLPVPSPGPAVLTSDQSVEA